MMSGSERTRADHGTYCADDHAWTRRVLVDGETVTLQLRGRPLGDEIAAALGAATVEVDGRPLARDARLDRGDVAVGAQLTTGRASAADVELRPDAMPPPDDVGRPPTRPDERTREQGGPEPATARGPSNHRDDDGPRLHVVAGPGAGTTLTLPRDGGALLMATTAGPLLCPPSSPATAGATAAETWTEAGRVTLAPATRDDHAAAETWTESQAPPKGGRQDGPSSTGPEDTRSAEERGGLSTTDDTSNSTTAVVEDDEAPGAAGGDAASAPGDRVADDRWAAAERLRAAATARQGAGRPGRLGRATDRAHGARAWRSVALPAPLRRRTFGGDDRPSRDGTTAPGAERRPSTTRDPRHDAARPTGPNGLAPDRSAGVSVDRPGAHRSVRAAPDPDASPTASNTVALDGEVLSGPTTWREGDVLWLGPSVLRLAPAAAAHGVPAVDGDGRSAVRARPSAAVAVAELPAVPAVDDGVQDRTPLSVATLAVPAVLGLVLAVLVDPRLALFVLLGPIMTLGTWGEGRGRASRETRGAARRRLDAQVELVDALPATAAALVASATRLAPDPATAITALHTGTQLWTAPSAARGPRHLPSASSGQRSLGASPTTDGSAPARGAATTDRTAWRTAPEDALVVHLGTRAGPACAVPGDLDPVAEAPAHAAVWRPDVPVVAPLSPGDVLAVDGDPDAARGLLAGVLLSLAASLPPSRLRCSAVTDPAPASARPPTDDADGAVADASVERGRPDVTGGPGHGHGPVDLAAIVGWLPHGATGEAEQHVVLVDIADPDQRHAAVAESLASGATVLTTSTPDDVLTPTVAVHVGADGEARLTTTATADDPDRSSAVRHGHAGPDPVAESAFVAAVVDDDTALRAAASAARWTEPRTTARDGDTTAGSDDVPSSTATLLRRWRRGTTTTSLHARLGVTPDGDALAVDLVGDGPHALVAGTTGSGKSVLLQRWLLGLALEHAPDDLGLVLVDFKGGAAFDDLADLPHVAGAVTNLDGGAERLVTGLGVEVRRRETVLRDLGAAATVDVELATARRHGLRRLLVVVDEFAALATEHPEAMDALVDVAQRGRSLGVHLVLATQRPAGVVNERIRANTDLRVCLRVTDQTNSMDVVDVPDAAALDPDRPGAALVRRAGRPVEHVRVDHLGDAWLAPRPVRVLQWRDATDDGPSRMAVGVAVARAAWPQSGRALPPPVLADDLPTADVLPWPPEHAAHHDGLPVGIADDLPRQTWSTVAWQPRDGALLLLGGARSGLDRAVLGILDTCLRSGAEVHALDGDGAMTVLAAHPGVGTVAPVDDVTTQRRLLALLARELGDRQRPEDTASPERPAIVLALHRLELLWERLNATDRLADRAALLDLLARGPAVGIHVVASSRRATGLGATVLANVADRLVMRLDEDVEHAAAGLAWGEDPPDVAGRGRHLGSGLVVQLPLPSRPTAAVHHHARRLEAVGETVALASLPTPRQHDGRLLLPLGQDLLHLEPTGLAPAAGEHVLVTGPRRSGRSSALALVAHQVLVARPGTALVVWAPSRSPWASHTACEEAGRLADRVRGATGPTLLVLDDAELLDAPGLDAAVTAAGDHVMVVVAAESSAARGLYGHVVKVVQRSRTSLLLQPDRGDLDATGLRGVALPDRRLPGRGLLVRPEGCNGVQLAGAPPPAALRDAHTTDLEDAA